MRPVRHTVVVALLASVGCVTPSPSQRTGGAPPSEVQPAACCSALERAILSELNRARTEPREFAAALEARLPHYRGNVYRRPNGDVGLRTVEGASAAREAIAVLRATRPLLPLRLSRGMSAAAADHVRDQGPAGALGHRGRDGSAPASRISRYGRWFGLVSENIHFGRTASGHEVVAELLIDDGVADRGHRKNALDPNIRVAGVACGPHAMYGQMCVIVHAGDFSEGSTENRRRTGAY